MGAEAWMADHVTELILGFLALLLAWQANRMSKATVRLGQVQATPLLFPSPVERRFVEGDSTATVLTLSLTNLGGTAAAVRECKVIMGNSTLYLQPVAVTQPASAVQRDGWNGWGSVTSIDWPVVEPGRAPRLHFVFRALPHDPRKLEDHVGSTQFVLCLDIVGGPTPRVSVTFAGPGSSRQSPWPTSEMSPYGLAHEWHKHLVGKGKISGPRAAIRRLRKRVQVQVEFRRYLAARKQAGFIDAPPPSWWRVLIGKD